MAWWGVEGAKLRGSPPPPKSPNLGHDSPSEVTKASPGSGVPIADSAGSPHGIFWVLAHGVAPPMGDFGPQQLPPGKSENSLG